MGLPGHRRTSSHKRRRAAHFALKTNKLVKCSKCQKGILAHHVCPYCGYYLGKEVIKIKVKKSKAPKK
ncbi:MAG: 50S ribosomal protein L32 [Candidatus Buchananbacteria bacterium]